LAGPQEIKKYLFVANDNERTFQYDDTLPPLLLTELEHTLDAYYDSCKPFLSDEELRQLQDTLGCFQNGVGSQLHAMLKEKADKEKNWVW
jgi:carnitine O-octanoyltransferase